MTIRTFPEIVQGSDEWLAVRRGIITASEVKHLITATRKPANNEKTRAHIYELAAQRISGFVEPSYVGDDMLRGMDDEIYARAIYHEQVAPVDECGFITNDKWGFTLGYSPDGLVGDKGLIEIKGRRQKFQVQTIIECAADMIVPDDYQFQVQTGLLVAEREWLDFISYCGGLPMCVIRAYPDEELQAAILEAAKQAEERIAEIVAAFGAAGNRGARLFPTERRIMEEMTI